jgi:glyoxylase-like metal-dependent hydrolase (beta-lactamase superfamily II)
MATQDSPDAHAPTPTPTGSNTLHAPHAEQIFPDVYRLDCPFGDGGLVHVYYLHAPEPALVDTGVTASATEVIQPALAARGFALEDVRHIFNTHGHWDHMGGNGAVRAIATGAKTYVHAADVHLLASMDAQTGGYTTYPMRLLGDRDALATQQEMLRRSIQCPTPVDVRVEDGQTFDLGGGVRLRAIFTPGHSLGSTSYLLDGTNALFTGDGIQGLGSRPGQLPLVFEDSRAYRGSIARVADLHPAALCMGHAFCGLRPEGGRDPVRRGAAAQAYLEESGEAAKAVEEAMRSVLRDAPRDDFLAVARAVFARIAGPLGVELDAQGLSVRSLATVHAFYREQTGAAFPV